MNTRFLHSLFGLRCFRWRPKLLPHPVSRMSRWPPLCRYHRSIRLLTGRRKGSAFGTRRCPWRTTSRVLCRLCRLCLSLSQQPLLLQFQCWPRVPQRYQYRALKQLHVARAVAAASRSPSRPALRQQVPKKAQARECAPTSRGAATRPESCVTCIPWPRTALSPFLNWPRKLIQRPLPPSANPRDKKK